MVKNDAVYLRHIGDAIADIKQYTQAGYEDFLARKIVQDAVLRNLEIIGEAVKNLSPEYRQKNQEIPWKQMAGLRDILIHHYFGIDLDIVWLVVEKRLPAVEKHINDTLARNSSH